MVCVVGHAEKLLANTLAFFSSRVEKTDKYCKCCWGEGEERGLTDLETGGVT